MTGLGYFDYQASVKLVQEDPPFYALIAAAMRKADTTNTAILDRAFPLVRRDLQARYEAPGGFLLSDGEQLIRNVAGDAADEILARLRAPVYRGGDGYSESWEVPCPSCDAILDYQRFLHGRGDPGRFCNDDSVMHECHTCGLDLEGFDPEPLIAAARSTGRVS